MSRWVAAVGVVVAASGCMPQTSKRSHAPPAQPAPYLTQRLPNGHFARPLAPPPPVAAPQYRRTHLLGAALAQAGAWWAHGQPTGWTNVYGLPVPLVPGLTTPVGPTPAPAPAGMPAPAAAAPATGPGVCGEVNVGGRAIPLDCAPASYGIVPGAQRAVVSRGWLGRGKGFVGASELPDVVDHRQNATEGPVRDQGRVGACTAFSFATAVDHALAVASGRPQAVSAMHVWSRYHRPYMSGAAGGNKGRGLSTEASWPYDERKACSWFSDCDSSCGRRLGVRCGGPSRSEVRAADGRAKFEVTNITELDVRNMHELKEVLAKGRDIWFAMHVDRRFDRLEKGGIVRDLRYERRVGHAMVLSGYQVEPDGTYFLIHNSWGRGWGNDGYAWIHERTLERNLKTAYLVDAAPIGAAPPAPGKKPAPPPEPKREKETVCQGGLLPDSVTGECVPPCDDGSPRAGGACPVASQCPAGKVNLFGFCVPAPRPQQNRDRGTGIQWQCGAGGCTYVVPGGVAGCSVPVCMVSCAAPRFVLTAGPNGLECSE